MGIAENKKNHDPTAGAWRFELKYRISYFDYYKIRSALAPYMKKDFFTLKEPDEKYLVRSLYYDTYDYKAYDEKMSGDCDRIKFRLRTYSDTYSDDVKVRAELKVRRGNAMEKFTAFVKGSDYRCFMHNGLWNVKNPVLDEYARYVYMRELKPQILIQYFREGFEERARGGLRITFDHNVQSIQSDTLFPEKNAFLRHHMPHTVVLEIKCRNERPQWLRSLVRDHGLKIIANSKFTQGIQASRHDLYHPDGVVLVR
ncbi:MAG: polyphosphate polymerase domain-containing protein [Spirochaetes bacterium]|nr:polyphosphate polymerase domain-containing protein [Spirochaetota bacterium]MBN2772432.1 polyphosphate polymerase domain-containing protein [Spirochaetota bacterium]